jgi:tetrahydromethanopterin S-methyltransferase subunit D
LGCTYLVEFDRLNQKITLLMITLSSFHCNRTKRHFLPVTVEPAAAAGTFAGSAMTKL